MSDKATSVVAPERRILRRAEVEQKTGFKRAHLYGLMKAGQFPQRIRLGVRAVGWDSLEIEQWITQRLQERALPAATPTPPESPRQDKRTRQRASRTR
jgi:prophage regulatory protein